MTRTLLPLKRRLTKLYTNSEPIWLIDHSATTRYSIAILLFIIATLLRWILLSQFGGFEFITYYPTVLLVAILLGAGPAILTVAFAAVTTNFLFISPSGEWKWATHHVVPMLIFSLAGLLVILISHRTHRYAIESRKDKRRLRALYDTSPDAILIVNQDGAIVHTNRQVSRLFGYTHTEVVGLPFSNLVLMPSSDLFQRFMIKADADDLLNTDDQALTTIARCKDARELDIEVNFKAIRTDEGCLVVCTVRDVSSKKLAEKRIEELAYFDQLTRLPNRALFMDRLKQAMNFSGRSNQYGALILIDLDNFKALNDTLGHDIGDQLLQQIASRLSNFLKEDYTVARLGGDDFAFILTHLAPELHEAALQTEIVAKNIIEALGGNYQLGSAIHRCSASLGISLFKDKRNSAEALFKQAELTMYKAKASGRNSIRFFDPAMEVAIHKRVSIEDDMRQALRSEQFLLHYQAQVLGDAELIGAEALLRWQHPTRGLVSPIEFIPIAEETGMILPLGLWVLETACQQLTMWAKDERTSHLTLAVNVSALQIKQSHFVEEVLDVLHRTGANPERLKLELTESLLVEDIEDIIQKMVALKKAGVGFSLDDFGTGYSSLTYLKRLPLDQLKIDRSFVQDVLTDPNDAAIAKTIVALADRLGFTVIAEGVETAAQRDFLIENDCYAFQGYFFGRPLPAKEFQIFIEKFRQTITEQDEVS